MNDNSKPLDVNAEANELKARMGVSSPQSNADANAQAQTEQASPEVYNRDHLDTLERTFGISAQELVQLKASMRLLLSDELKSVQDMKVALSEMRVEMQNITAKLGTIFSELHVLEDIEDRLSLLLDMNRNPEPTPEPTDAPEER